MAGRPRRVNQHPRRRPEPVVEPPVVHEPPPLPPPADEPRLYAVNGPEIEATAFGRVTSLSTRYALIKDGKIQGVWIGRRVYLSDRAMADFISRGGSR